MDERTSRQSIVVTGASAGIGRAIALRLAADGARLTLIARDGSALEEVSAEVRGRGAEALPVACDVADSAAVFGAADRAVQRFGGIDVWINNAMVTVFGEIGEITPEEVRRVTDVTYLGVVHGTMAALAHMRAADRGLVVQIGSALAYRGIPLQAAYCGAKHAIQGFTESVRAELAHAGSGIAVSELQLPAVNTPQFDWARTHRPRRPRPAGTVHQPEAIAEIVARTVRRPKREVWIGGQSILIIVGNQLAPGLVDRYLGATAVEGQATDEPVEPDRADNLEHPVTGLHRTRGRFDAEAKPRAFAAPAGLLRTASLASALLLAFLLGAVLGNLVA